MSYGQAILLGIIQGIGEFLPISSSGHLFLAKYFLNLQEEIPVAFDIALHVATLFAVFAVFRKKIFALLQAFGHWLCKNPKKEESADLSMCFVIIFATFITGCVGYPLQKLFPTTLTWLAVGFVYTSVLLLSLRFLPTHTTWSITKQAIILGLLQSIAVFPGISRSGSTIFASILCGYRREEAGEFSFILSIPIICAAFLLSLKDLHTMTSSVAVSPVVVGMLVAFVTGIGALSALLPLIKKAKLWYFSPYLLGLAIFIFLK